MQNVLLLSHTKAIDDYIHLVFTSKIKHVGREVIIFLLYLRCQLREAFII